MAVKCSCDYEEKGMPERKLKNLHSTVYKDNAKIAIKENINVSALEYCIAFKFSDNLKTLLFKVSTFKLTNVIFLKIRHLPILEVECFKVIPFRRSILMRGLSK